MKRKNMNIDLGQQTIAIDKIDIFFTLLDIYDDRRYMFF